MKLSTQVQLLPSALATLIAIHRWKQLLLSTHSAESKCLMTSPVFSYTDFLSASEQCSCFWVLYANWDVWGDGKLADHWSKKRRRERERKTKKEKEVASDKQSRGEMLHSCQAGSCPRCVTHLPPQTGCTQELPASSAAAFSLLSHTLLQRQASSSHTPPRFWNKLQQRQVPLQRKMRGKKKQKG